MTEKLNRQTWLGLNKMGIGRPVGSTNDKSWRAALSRAVHHRVNGRGSPRKLDIIADKCADEAMNGESWAVRAPHGLVRQTEVQTVRQST